MLRSLMRMKIGLASPEKIRSFPMVKLKKLKRLTIEH